MCTRALRIISRGRDDMSIVLSWAFLFDLCKLAYLHWDILTGWEPAHIFIAIAFDTEILHCISGHRSLLI